MQGNIDFIEAKENVGLYGMTSFKIGGPAKKVLYPSNIEEIKAAVTYCRENALRYMVLGNGSNVLFSDEGYDGIIIQIAGRMNDIRACGEEIFVEAGATLGKIAAFARDNSLTGFEFAGGIPGTLGGAIVMNAGAYGGEMKDVVEYVDVFCKDNEIHRFSCEEMDFSYRHSIIDENMVVLGAKIKLKNGDRDKIIARMNELKEARLSKQPLEYPSAGSTFKRPKGYFAGKLIEDAGLKGYRIGDAMVSDKHSGFVINCGNANCKDVLSLINYVQKTVLDKFKVWLEPEVKIIK